MVAVCDVDRTVVNPAPLGAFHLHELHSEWSSWIEYHIGRRVQIRRSGQRYWGTRCPDLRGARLVISFPRLVRDLSPPDHRYARWALVEFGIRRNGTPPSRVRPPSAQLAPLDALLCR